jgi:hypothetical protein
MRSMPTGDGARAPKPAIRITWKEWWYLNRAALSAPNHHTTREVIAWLYDNAAWADDRILLPWHDDKFGHA